MRIRTIDFNQYDFSKVHIDGGFQGEHRATQLEFICSIENPDDKTFKLVFEPGGESETLYSINGKVKYEIPQSLTKLKKVKLTLEAYEGEIRIYKAPVVWLNFAPSATASEPVIQEQESFRAEVAEINKRLNTAIDEISDISCNPVLEKVNLSTSSAIRLSDVSPNNHFINIKIYKKNLVPFPYMDGNSKTTDGIKFSVNSDGTISARGVGIALKNYATFYLTDKISFLDGEKYSLGDKTVVSFDHNGHKKYFGKWNSPFIWKKSYKSPKVYAEIPKGEGVVVTTIKPQLEYGEALTAYERGIDCSNVKINVSDDLGNITEYSVNSYGTARIKSISPYMKIEVSDKNLNIAFEYQKDINTADYEKLENLPKINGSELKGDFKITKETLGVKDGAQGLKGDRGPQGLKGDKGEEGFSPTVEVASISGGSRLVFKDKSGQKSIDIMDGKDGAGGVDLPLTEDKTNFFDATPTLNLLNINDAENKEHSQIRVTDGRILTNPGWGSIVSHKINVADMPRDLYRTNKTDNIKVAEYGADDSFIKINNLSDKSKPLTLTDSTEYLRIEYWLKSNLVFGRSKAPLTQEAIPFGYEYELKKKYVNNYLPKAPLITTPVIAQKATLLNGEELKTEDVPQVKVNYEIGFRAKINSFESLKIGNEGLSVYCSSAVTIDNTNLTITRLDHTQESTPHGLTIGDYIEVVIVAKDDLRADIAITTNSGTVQKNMYWNGSAGTIKAVSKNSNLTDCYLSWYSPDLFKPIWAFGDSYFDGWPQILTAKGFKNWMIDGVSGTASLTAWQSLQKAIKFSTPEKIFWCMGMNDADPENWMNGAWKQRYLDVANYCDSNGIELILSTIPTNRNSKHDFKNKFIREESGRRYVDIAKAVGADISPEWYEGLLSEDGTHPTYKGNLVIANRVAIDVPELKSFK